jgi:hypothetical protein
VLRNICDNTLRKHLRNTQAFREGQTLCESCMVMKIKMMTCDDDDDDDEEDDDDDDDDD